MSNSTVDVIVESMTRVEMINVRGRVDSNSVGELENGVNSVLERKKYNIVFELSGVEYMSSAGLRVLISTLRTCTGRQGAVRLAAVSERVGEVLELAGIKPMFSVYENAVLAADSF